MAYYCYDCNYCIPSSGYYKCNANGSIGNYKKGNRYGEWIKDYDKPDDCPAFELFESYCNYCKHISGETKKCINSKSKYYDQYVKGYKLKGRVEYNLCYEEGSSGWFSW